MYMAIHYDRKAGDIHIWDDKNGHFSHKHKPYAYRPKNSGKYVSIHGQQLEKITQFNPAAANLFESDVNVDTRTLIDLYGDSDEVSVNHRLAVIDIEVETKGGYPNMTTFNQPLTAIAVYDGTKKHYFCFVLDELELVKNVDEPDRTVRSFKTEEELILAFLDCWESIGPTIATGWNTDGFDFTYLFGRIAKMIDEKTASRLSPIGICYFNKFKNKMTIAGVNCLDYLLLYRRYSQKNLPNYRLDTVAKEELNMGKVEYEGDLNELKRTDIKKFIEYNIRDIQLIVMLDDKMKFIELAMSICHVCHVGYEEFHVSSRFLEGAVLTYLRRNDLVAPNKVFEREDETNSFGGDDDADEKFEGAYVKDPIVGRHEWVCSADINSLYPSVMMTLNISPETKIGKIDGWDTDKYVRGEMVEVNFAGEIHSIADFKQLIIDNNLSVSANGVIYDQSKKGCLPEIMKFWFAQRLEFKSKMKGCEIAGDKEGVVTWKRRQQVQKILLNSIYGCVGMKGWRFFDLDNAEAVTLTGQSIIKATEKFVNAQMNKKCDTKDVDYVIAVDTDSNYINFAPLVKLKNPTDPKKFCIEEITTMSELINKFYEILVIRLYNSTLNRIVISADVVASAALWTSKKHYAMLQVYDTELKKDIDKLKVIGLDVVRSSYPKKFREFMSTVLMDLLRSTTKKLLDAKILSFKDTMKGFELQDIAKNTSVAFVSKTEAKINYNPKNRELFTFIKGCTAQCKAALAYNDMLKKYNLTDTEPIMSGGKIKWVYLVDNPLSLDGLAFKDDGRDPKLIMDFLNTYVDRNRIWDSELQKKLADFYAAIGWDIFSVDGDKIDEFFSFE
jgi:DNA polymerase elongation subunit (family B)